jgi:hypothetical protein
MGALKVIYVLAIAAALIALVVVGINTFYPAPESPDCHELLGPKPDYDNPAVEQWDQDCSEIFDAYWQEVVVYGGHVFLIALPLGVVIAVVGAFIQRRTSIFGAGLIVGGMGTMIFALTPYNPDNTPKFIGIAVILAVLIFVGYKLFFSRRRG